MSDLIVGPILLNQILEDIAALKRDSHPPVEHLMVHGKDCEKVLHGSNSNDSQYGHLFNHDAPYSKGDSIFCGRCHVKL